MADKTAMEELVEGLTASLTKALTPDEGGAGAAKDEGTKDDAQKALDERLAKMEASIATITTGVETLTKMLAPGDDKGEGRGEITKSIAAIAETVGVHHTALETILDRSAVKKSIDGDDFDESKGGKSEPVLKASEDGKSLVIKTGTFDGVIRAALAGKTVALN